MELRIYSLPYPTSVWEYYHLYNKLPGFALLQSTDRARGRYDILTAFPYDQFTIERNCSNIAQLWDGFQDTLKVKSSCYDYPFQGGAIGYISYDFGEYLAGLNFNNQTLEDNLPLIDLKFYDWAIIVDHHQQKAEVVAAHQHTDTKTIISDIIQQWKASINQEPDVRLSKAFSSPISQDAYLNAFSKIHHALRWGRAYQVNYTIPFLAEFNDDPWLIYEKVSLQNKVPYAAFLRHSEFDILSFSPERFLLGENQNLFVSPIKGSAPRSDDHLLDERYQLQLKLSEKNRAENIMIVDLLRNDLGKIALPGTVRVQSLCELQSYAQVHHLVSNIEAKLKSGTHPLEAFKACFPGGSITGAPKLEAMRIIREREPYARGIYCGNIGYFSNHGRFDMNIAIRTIIAQKNKLYLRAGGGIVMDSNVHEEYEECYTKIKAIINEITI
ncbi:aminodeoxychorismate synthase component I [Legionella yabuuchiae]|uniref:aminodeoxychorismate synthase component I n=1 Tax=Legionella yabuuchiae TaxID=376727 RepID=UPI001056A94A|nr:aminodeoxychorismate synthase component I [Legionella yabuuchiae]